MLLIPVIDVQDGLVVHGRFGNRAEYRPIQSVLCEGADPLTIARAFRSHFELTEIYLADLDAIVRRQPHFQMYRDLAEAGFKLWIDPGIRVAEDWADQNLKDCVHRIVVGSETLQSRNDLSILLDRWGVDRLVFSLDLREGKPLTNSLDWLGIDSGELVQDVYAMGARHILILDLARVGSGQEIGTESLVKEALRTHSDLQIYVGGGVSGTQSVRRIRETRVAGVLVASALHDGRIRSTEDLL
ncbi:hisA/hisF family protein [bacterium]|nr:hisA/hisF family protein [bacterium]